MKDEPIDNDLKTITSPVDAVEYYMPSLIAGKRDIMQIKKELRQEHGFSEEDVKITARILSNEHLRHTLNKSYLSNGYFGLVVGIVLLLAGLALTAYLWKIGFVATVSLVIIAASIGVIIKSLITIAQQGK